MGARQGIRSVVAGGLAAFCAGLGPCAAEELLAVRPDDIVWKEVRKDPPLFRAYVQGDQDQPGAFTFRVRAAAGHKLMPHTHPDDRVITVLEGTYWSATSAVWDEAKLVAFPRGSFYVVPAGVPHYSAVLEGETVFQESGIGPSRNDMVPQGSGNAGAQKR
ncbi:MAG: cupin domain-containing protein [Burkholderiales bacterium]|nr:cupin domain-containing protein [Burkholderiales bacterium]